MVSPDKWAAVKQLFQAALEEDSALRSSFLKARCKDAIVLAEVERLLAEHDQAGGFLSIPVLGNPPTSEGKRTPTSLEKRRALNIGPFIVLGEVGRGGMGIVYKAKDPANNRTVAIKIIQGSAALNQQGRMGLVREARSAGTLHHRNILEIYDIGQYKGWLFLVMEYLHGAPLSKIIQRGNDLQISQKLDILVQLGEALDHAHSRGVVHRDIKPGNIFVTRERIVKVVDFGIAIQSDAVGNRPIAGTIPYLAPEQLKGAEQDAVSDLWSAGITMYELLTGKLPFSGPNLAHQIVSCPLPALDTSIPLSSDLSRVLQKALSKNKEERYSTARGFVADLRSLQKALEMSSYQTAEFIQPVLVDKDSLAKTEHAETTITTRQQEEFSQQPDYLSELDLGFRVLASGGVVIRSGRFRFKGLVRWVGTLLSRAISWIVPLSLISPLGVLAIPLALALVLPFWYLSIPVLSLILAIKGAELMARNPRCHSCFLPMLHTSRWTRFAKTRTEVRLGYQDCTAALQEGLWQEAAKLLNVHGFEPSSFFSNRFISPPLRYHLDFYECSTCRHHAARMTADDLVDERWVPGLRFTEAYQGTKPDHVSRLEILCSILPRIASGIANPLRHSDPVRFSSRVFVVAVAGLVGALVFAVLAGLHYRESRINTLYFATSRAASAKVDPVITARNEGLAWYQGWRRPLDRQKAAWCFEFAAKRGDSFSANILGTMNEEALGIPQNYDRALSWYKQAAQQGNSDAEFNLGRLYESGIGVKRDTATALHWYALAAQGGNKEAANRMSHLLPN